ncbi:aminopeptidase S [Geomicrobium sp. JCM 19037]|uniref:aminopeptidase n=1 Tax=Geomicrobium sp. JCM 19037 TaxID=1460634 RepID=UPI00045F4DAB|nr:aminopeptidase [Geomicrobium sp. JCM 19037]GAK03986.1 aminopeptidase S [Geomicrobium sp. JCM 19037]
MSIRAYAQIIIQIGIRVKPGELVRVNCHTEHLALVQEIVKEAYRRGAQHVELDVRDPSIEDARTEHVHEEFLHTYPEVAVTNEKNNMQAGYSTITITSPTFSQYADENLQKRALAVRQAKARAMRPVRQFGMENHNKWVVVCAPTTEWAVQLFPDLSEAQSLEQLWSLILNVCGAYETDPVFAWKRRDEALKQKVALLNDALFDALRFVSPVTDLTVTLIDGHRWTGGSERTKDGRVFLSNIPVEEVWTMPDKRGVTGFCTLTKPVHLLGQTFEDLQLFFETGRLVRIEPPNARLFAYLQTDDGASRLGEVALVAADAAVAKTGVTFLNVLLDENAASHIAFGGAYVDNLYDGEQMSVEERMAVGMNESAIHEDVMIGSEQMNVYGLKAERTVLIMEHGRWQI